MHIEKAIIATIARGEKMANYLPISKHLAYFKGIFLRSFISKYVEL